MRKKHKTLKMKQKLLILFHS